MSTEAQQNPKMADKKIRQGGRRKRGGQPRLVRLADLLCTSIDWIVADKIDDIFPGFLEQYGAAQDRWETSDENQDFTLKRHRRESNAQADTRRP